MMEFAHYILDQFQKEKGTLPYFTEFKKSQEYNSIFEACVKDVLDVLAVDFPDKTFTDEGVSRDLCRSMIRTDRMPKFIAKSEPSIKIQVRVVSS